MTANLTPTVRNLAVGADQGQPPCAADPDAWFSTNPAVQQECIRICRACPMQAACAPQAALNEYGIWGGVVAHGTLAVGRDAKNCLACGRALPRPRRATGAPRKYCDSTCRNSAHQGSYTGPIIAARIAEGIRARKLDAAA